MQYEMPGVKKTKLLKTSFVKHCANDLYVELIPYLSPHIQRQAMFLDMDNMACL
jgi:hypothetical protein